jgi:hypothetical protein
LPRAPRRLGGHSPCDSRGIHSECRTDGARRGRIVAIEGLIPDRRLSASATPPAAPPVKPQIYEAEWLRKQQHQAAGEESGDALATAETQPAAPRVHVPEPTPEPAPKPPNETSFPNLGNQPSPVNPFINPGSPNWVPDATGHVFDAVLDRGNSLRLSFSPDKRFSGPRRGGR